MNTTIKVSVLVGLLLTSTSAQSATMVKLTPEHGGYLAPVEINGAAPLPFLIDTGSSTVSIPADKFWAIYHRGADNRDVTYIGSGVSILADGSKVPTNRYVLREIRIGSFPVKNVSVSVMSKGDLLLGMNVLSQLPPWSIDYKQHVLVINDVPAQQAAPKPAPEPAISMYDKGIGTRFVWDLLNCPQGEGCAGWAAEILPLMADPEFRRGWDKAAGMAASPPKQQAALPPPTVTPPPPPLPPPQQGALSPPKRPVPLPAEPCPGRACYDNGKAIAPITMYDRGVVDRAAWEKWYEEQTGSYRDGAYYWADVRSNPKPFGCKDRSQLYVTPSEATQYAAGCEAAKAGLALFDALRKSNPEYKLGWNDESARITAAENESLIGGAGRDEAR